MYKRIELRLLFVAPLLAAGLVWSAPTHAAVDSFAGWKHSGSLVLLTTPDGADLPDGAVEKDFPVLVRLRKEWFDFREAQPSGADIRFADAKGQRLLYQIDLWDALAGRADIWVRVPEIRGNARQVLQMFWGKPDAENGSDGAAVFNPFNGYAAVLHLGDSRNRIVDETGTVQPTDKGTTPSAGIIGIARHFEPGQGIACGEAISGLPAGQGPHTTQAWFRAQRVNTMAVGWGNEQAQGKVTMNVHSPPHVRMECYFSSADVAGGSRLPMSEWVHVVHTYKPGDSRVYLNGRLDGTTAQQGALLHIRQPARMWLGGWYGNFQFAGEIDEVRISKVARSADWVKLEYENQKPLQTLVGTLARPGRELAVSPEEISVDEGRTATVTARAGGAEKVYWILQRQGQDRVVAVDRFDYTLPAGRVIRNEQEALTFKAVYPDGVKTRSVPVQIQDVIPEPQFTLQAPARWDGRQTIEVVPAISNLPAMQAQNAAALNYRWTVSGGAVIKQVAADRLILKRSLFSGLLTVTAAIDNNGAPTVASATIRINQPEKDPWVLRVADNDERPEENQFYARDENNEGTLHYNGVLERPAGAVFLKVFADDKPWKTEVQPLAADRSFRFAVKLKPGLIVYRIELGSKTGDEETVVYRAGNLVCGDAYLIQGQSNALATDTQEEAPRETSPWIRSYGGPRGRQGGNQWLRRHVEREKSEAARRINLWCLPVWKARPEDEAELGYWGMELAKRLVASQKMPVFIINGAVGGTRIDEHAPTPDNPADLSTIYGRTLWRIRQARLTHGIRAIIWHQGESDQGSHGPTGGYGWETYQSYFVDMSAAWKEDFPNVQHYYVFQIWPNACSMGGRHGSGDRLREVQRTLPRLYSHLHIMSTLGIRPRGDCHYPLAGWGEFARLLQPLIERDIYGNIPGESISPPDLRRARYTTPALDEIELEWDQPLKPWHAALVQHLYLDDQPAPVRAGEIRNHSIFLKLMGTPGKQITYLKEKDWKQENLILGANGIAALTFADVTIERP